MRISSLIELKVMQWIWISLVVILSAAIVGLVTAWALTRNKKKEPTLPGLNPRCYLSKQSCEKDPDSCTKVDPHARCMFNPKTKAFQCCRIPGHPLEDFPAEGPLCGCTPRHCVSPEICWRNNLCAWPCSASKPCPFSGTVCKDGVCQDAT